ncbi:MAG TPA: hypothetical protein VF397_02270 [Pyrinomonadaceae bacterium]
MKIFLGRLVGLFLLATSVVHAQPQTRAPFAILDEQVRSQPAGWNGDKSKLSTVFAAERLRLGRDFESALMKYIANDAEKHYWISAFLEYSDYLHGNKSLPHLSMLIIEEGLALLRDKTDDDSVGLSLSFNVVGAVLAEKLGLNTLAISHKNDAERRLAENADWGAFFPAMSEEERRLYDGLPSAIKRVSTSLPGGDAADRPKTRVSGGVLNSRAINLPLPSYPSADASGEVVVSIVYDETGKVIWARAMSGPTLLQKPAEDAARKATFPPFKLEGKLEKVSGVLIYRFVR